MKKVLISILSILVLLSSSLVFTSCKNTTPPPENLELSTIKLTTDNISTYLACNVEYSEYSIKTIDNKTYYIVKASITTSPRLKDIIFEDAQIIYDDFWLSSSWQTKVCYAQLDYQGYSTTSTYLYSIENTTGFNKHDLPPLISAPIKTIQGNVIVPTEAE